MAPLGPCEATILALANVTPDAHETFPEAGGIYALLDPQNVPGAGPTPSKGDGLVSVDGGIPTVKLLNYPRVTTASRDVHSCENLSTPALATNNVTLTNFKEQAFDVTAEELAQLCGDANKIAGQGLTEDKIRLKADNTPFMKDVRARFMAVLKALVRDVNSEIVDGIITKVGTNVVSGDALGQRIDAFTTDRSATPNVYKTLKSHQRKNGISSMAPLILGGDNIAEYGDLLDWACCNDSGIDLAKMASMNKGRYYYDVNIDTAWGAGHFITWAPGTLRMITYPVNQGIFASKHGESYFGSFTVPEFPGIEFDLQIKAIDCPDRVWRMIISTHFDVFGAPSPYAAGDRLEGVNGVFRYIAKEEGEV